MQEAGAAVAHGASTVADKAKTLASEAADAAVSAGAAVGQGAQSTLEKAKSAGANALSGAGELASKAAGAVVTGAEKVTGKDLNKDGKIG